jgi:hypothetical protein
MKNYNLKALGATKVALPTPRKCGFSLTHKTQIKTKEKNR